MALFDGVRAAVREWRELGIGEPALWRDARMVFAEVPVDADVVRHWLPAGVRLATPARATVFVGDYPHTTFAPPYREAALLLHVTLYGAIPAMFCPWMVLDNDRALILGRELLGFPKKMAEIRFAERGDSVEASVRRHGTEVLHVTGRIAAPVSPPPGLGQRIVNARGSLNALLPGHLLLFHPGETVHRCNAIAGQVTLRPGADDPVGVAAGPAFSATIRTCDIRGGWPPLRVGPVSPLFFARQMRLRVR